jgi:NAD(P)-dependent dehydrogenase (short-subunit alcohol dehydrogenase family)
MLADDRLVEEPATMTAIVTGGASRIGKAACDVLARKGYLVAVADRDELGARAVADACGGFAFALDVTDEAAVAAAFTRAFELLGERLDGLVTAAGTWDGTPFLEAHRKTFRTLSDLSVVGTHLAIRAAVRHMKPGARICTVAGGAGPPDGLESAADCATRGAVTELTRGAAAVLAARGIAVNGVVVATRTRTDDALVRQEQDADGVAEAIAWLLSPNAARIRGTILTTDG